MSLMGLPPELLCQIIRETIPIDYESFVLSCRTIYEIGREFLEKHNRLRRRFRRFQYDDSLQCSLQLLWTIARDPIIAEYIQSANFLDDVSPEKLQLKGLKEWDFFLGDGNAVQLIKDVFKQSQLPQHVNSDPHEWLKRIATGNTIGALSILATTVILSLLPNLEALVLPKQWANFTPAIGNTPEDEKVALWKAWDWIVQEANVKDNRPRALSKVTRMSLFHAARDDRPLGLSILSPFLILPSLREFRASNCLANRAWLVGKPFSWRYPSYISNLEKVEFAWCCMDAAELSNFLVHTPRLRSFKLSYASKWWGCGFHWDANEIFVALRSHCANSLTELSITIDRIDGHVKGGLCSLKDFVNLEDLELDTRVFFGPPVVTEELRDMSPIDYRNYAYSTARWNGSAVPNLTSILPSSIKRVRLLTGFYREDILILKSLLAHHRACAASTLPHLNGLSVTRATYMIGDQRVTPGQSVVAWNSVGDVVRSAGYEFDEHDVVKASWLHDFYQRPGE